MSGTYFKYHVQCSFYNISFLLFYLHFHPHYIPLYWMAQTCDIVTVDPKTSSRYQMDQISCHVSLKERLQWIFYSVLFNMSLKVQDLLEMVGFLWDTSLPSYRDLLIGRRLWWEVLEILSAESTQNLQPFKQILDLIVWELSCQENSVTYVHFLGQSSNQ